MRVFAVVPALSVVLAAASSFAQTPPAPRPPGQTPPAAQQPATPPPATPPPGAPQPAAPVQPAPEPFKEGMKYGYINVQDVASLSADGKAAALKLTSLRDKLQKDLQGKKQAIDAAVKKLESTGPLLADGGAQLRADIDRQTRDLERLAQDADEDIEKLTNQLQAEFMTKLRPAIDKVAREKQVDLVFNLQESGLIWAIAGTNLTADVIRTLDTAKAAAPAAAAPAAAAPGAAAPAAGAPAPTAKPSTPTPTPAAPTATPPR